MEDSCYSLPISNLICHEDKALSMSNEEMEEQWLPRILFNSFHSDTEEEYIEILVSKEKSIESTSTEFLRCRWLRCEAIQWILNMKDYFGFSFQTVYLAVIYLDRFLMQRSIDKEKPWLVQLLTMACLSLAAKMDEAMAPPLVKYQSEQCCFDAITIRRMELHVLSTLEWRMNSVTPFAYLNYFAIKIIGSHLSTELLSKATGFIFSILKEINLVEFHASAIAAAAVLASFDDKLTKQELALKMKPVCHRGLLESEHVYSSYSLMTRAPKKRSMESDLLLFPHLSMTHSSMDSFVDTISYSSLADDNNKKRRLQKSLLD